MSVHDIAIGPNGETLPFSLVEVEAIVRRAIDTGKIIAAVMETEQGICVQVMGPPSRALADILDQVARNYRVALAGRTS